MNTIKWSTLSVLALVLAACTSTVLAARAPQEGVNPAPACNKHAVVWRTQEMPKNPSDGDIWVNPVDGMEMVYIAAGKFHMGSDQVADERPYRHVYVGAYWIAKYEVTVAQYRTFAQISGHTMPVEPAVRWLDASPIVNVDWNDAGAYAKWANGRLANETEWERAARGNKNIYPWGDTWDATKCNNGLNGKNAPMKVGSFPDGASEYGVLDMAGNVAEWCADQYKKDGDSMEYRVIRGGSCIDVSAEAYRASRRDYLAPSARVDVIGFRYVLDAK